MGKCTYCHEEKERASLSVCSRCMISEYCSRECSISAWPSHKLDCNVYYEYHHSKQRRVEKENNDKKPIRLNKEELEEKKNDIEELERIEQQLEEEELEKKQLELEKRLAELDD